MIELLKSYKPHYKILSIYDHEVHPQNISRNHLSEGCYAAWFIRKGRVVIESAASSIKATSGDWVFCDPFIQRSHHFSNGSHIISIRFTVHWQNFSHFPPLKPPQMVRLDSNNLLLSATQELLSVCHEVTNLSEDARLQARFMNWMAIWHQIQNRSFPAKSLPPSIQKLIEGLSQQLTSRVLNYDRLSSISGLSRSQIDKSMLLTLGVTPRQWNERHCLVHIEAALANPAASIKEIAGKFGFSDTSHFTKWFKKMTGLLPRQYQSHAEVGHKA